MMTKVCKDSQTLAFQDPEIHRAAFWPPSNPRVRVGGAQPNSC